MSFVFKSRKISRIAFRCLCNSTKKSTVLITKKNLHLNHLIKQSNRVFTESGAVSQDPPQYKYGFLKLVFNIASFVVVGSLITKFSVKLIEIAGLYDDDDTNDDDD